MLTPLLLSPPSALSDEQPGMRTQRPRIYKLPETGTQGPCRSCVGCFWFGSCLVSVKQPELEPKCRKRQWTLSPFCLALWAVLSVFLVLWGAGVLIFLFSMWRMLAQNASWLYLPASFCAGLPDAHACCPVPALDSLCHSWTCSWLVWPVIQSPCRLFPKFSMLGQYGFQIDGESL